MERSRARSVRQIMRRDAPTVQTFESLGEALHRMQQLRLRHLMVTSGDVLMGVVSYRDIQEGVLSGAAAGDRRRLLRETGVESAMRAPAASIAPDAPLHEAAARLRDLRIGCLPVVETDADGPHLVGVLDASDLLRAAYDPPRP